MKKWVKITLIILVMLILGIIADLICIFSINRPLFAIQTENNISANKVYKGIFYDTYDCASLSAPQIKTKWSIFSCDVSSNLVGKVVNIIDRTKEIKDFACAEALEEFYKDDNYIYYFNCIKSSYVIVKYDNGYTELVEDALKLGNIKISDLDEYNIDYIKYSNNSNLEYKYFIRTYNILNIAESNDYNYLYLTLRQFQCEEVKTVKVLRSLAKDVLVNDNYEFSFKYLNNNIEDNIDQYLKILNYYL